MNAFVERPPVCEYGATPGKARPISQRAPRCCCLTNRSAFVKFRIPTLRCAMHPNPPA